MSDLAASLSKVLAEISATVTASYPPGMDSELVLRRRVGKVGNEYGELLEAMEGYTGENPRKGVYATRADIINELLDCASAALCAVEFMSDDQGQSINRLIQRVTMQLKRLRDAL